jgi:hypothetical protein
VKKAEERIINLLLEMLEVAKTLAPKQSAKQATPAAIPNATSKPKGVSGVRGVYRHQSKYNPWRAAVWDKGLHASVQLGVFPGIAKAKAAQAAYRKNQTITTSPQAATQLRAVA